LGAGQYFYVATSRGQIVCLDSSTGKAAWGQDYDNGFYASPILVGDRIYAVDRRGTTYVFKTGPTYELIATSRLGEDVFATPAFLDGRVYIRTEKNLFCIANSNGT
jgi:outer membrane protein assembly factor BamB